MQALRNKSGLSLFFVLGSMMLLLALGVSALTAAGAAFGARFAQQNRNQLELFVSSTERVLLASLGNQEISMSDSTDDDTIGDWIIRRAVERFFDGEPGGIPPAIDPSAYIRHPATIHEASFFSIPLRTYDIPQLAFDVQVQMQVPRPDGEGTEPANLAVLNQSVVIEGTLSIEGSAFVRRHRTPYPNWPPPPHPDQPGAIPSEPMEITIVSGIMTAWITTQYTTPQGPLMSTVTWITLELTDPIILEEDMETEVKFHDDGLPDFDRMSVSEVGQWEVVMRGTLGS